jgi:hypothetical protein
MRGDISVHSDLLDLNDLIPPEMEQKFKKGNFESVNFAKKTKAPDESPAGRKGAHHFVETSDVQLNITAPRVQMGGSQIRPP